MNYSTIVRNYLAMQRGKPAPKSGQGLIIRNLIDLTTQRFGHAPSLIQTVGALLLAEYEVKDLRMDAIYYETSYLVDAHK